MAGDEQVIQHGDFTDHFHVLEGAHDALQHHVVHLFLHQRDDLAGLVFKQQCAGGGLIKLRDAVKHRGLSGAVGADETEYLAFFHGEGQAVHGVYAAEVHAQILHLQHRVLRQRQLAGGSDLRLFHSGCEPLDLGILGLADLLRLYLCCLRLGRPEGIHLRLDVRQRGAALGAFLRRIGQLGVDLLCQTAAVVLPQLSLLRLQLRQSRFLPLPAGGFLGDGFGGLVRGLLQGKGHVGVKPAHAAVVHRFFGLLRGDPLGVGGVQLQHEAGAVSLRFLLCLHPAVPQQDILILFFGGKHGLSAHQLPVFPIISGHSCPPSFAPWRRIGRSFSSAPDSPPSALCRRGRTSQ